jgi:non-heme chloroperoxidase
MKTLTHFFLASAFAAGATAHGQTPRPSSIALSTGVRMSYVEHGPASGHPVIFIHGYSDSWFSYSRVLPLLPPDVRGFALSLRGHGDSDRPASGYAMRDLAADVVAFMDAKRIVRATIVGHSMGSLVAQQVALAAPRRVSGIVLIGAARSIRHFAGVDDLKQVIDQLADPVPVEFIREFQESTVTVPVPPEFMKAVIAESAKLPLRVWRDLLAGMLATTEATPLSRAGIPALVLRGEKDTYAPAAEQDSLRALLGGAKFKEYAATGHAPHWERPAEFVADLQAFLAGRRDVAGGRRD